MNALLPPPSSRAASAAPLLIYKLLAVAEKRFPNVLWRVAESRILKGGQAVPTAHAKSAS